MPISSITQVLLRLAALNWFVAGIAQIATSAIIYKSDFSPLSFVSSGVLLIAGVLCWCIAPFLSGLFAKGSDRAITLEGVSLYNLYSTAFVSLGLYFALANFARIFSWLHYYITYKSDTSTYADPHSASYYNLSEPVMTFLAGVFLVATAHIWARKLTSKHYSEQGAAANP